MCENTLNDCILDQTKMEEINKIKFNEDILIDEENKKSENISQNTKLSKKISNVNL